jgi:periplasmic protein TonB
MFEDSTFETNGTIRTCSRNWMAAAFAFNGSILLALVLFPIIFPQALPHPVIPNLVDILLPPRAHQQQQQPAQAAPATPNALANPFAAPRTIPVSISTDSGPEVFTNLEIPGPALPQGVPGGSTGPGTSPYEMPIVRQEPTGPMRVPTTVVEGLLLLKTMPPYPAIARATHTEGTVVLEATISKAGAIENLRVMSGPLMLRQAAADAVRTWRYRPYLLDGQPIEVETTVNVIFSLQ